MTSFTLRATVPASYAETLARVRELLGGAGFGVLTEIDLTATLRAKLGVEVPQQVILGACMPQLAHRALEADPRIATMLPCNVVVADEGAETRVEIFDPSAMTSFSADAGVAEVAADARQRLTGMLEALTGNEKDDDAARA
ncbi:DUF302 domain-containing protein [Nocardioides luteus]|uniref:ABC transporter n=1 Tax=Nocardioides luteus TaxID=1844 RepID=A0A1J4MZP4_9ACTN|nr:DUF302 domain-containing protein [Nocardioides luteus]OIJ24789.1 ABC transporter [Nocardioides luteus]